MQQTDVFAFHSRIFHTLGTLPDAFSWRQSYVSDHRLHGLTHRQPISQVHDKNERTQEVESLVQLKHRCKHSLGPVPFPQPYVQGDSKE